jgi:hypothetical protein
MVRINISEMWKLTKSGKIVARSDRECPTCYEVGEIIEYYPFSKRLSIVRKCLNKECENYGELWKYAKTWSEYKKLEFKEIKKWIEKNNGVQAEFALKKIDAILVTK